MPKKEIQSKGIDMIKVARDIRTVKPRLDITDITKELSFPRRPPCVPKKEKDVSFPEDVDWMQMTSNPYLFFIRLTDATRLMIEEYGRWWSKQAKGEFSRDKDNDEKFYIDFDKVIVTFYRDNKYWFCDIKENRSE